MANSNSTYDLEELLSSPDRQYYLVNNSDDEVEIKSLKGKTVGLYFSAAWSGPCKRFTPILMEAYNEILSSTINGDFEIVLVSADEDEESFEDSFSKMPWVAIPFFDSETRSRLDEVLKVRGLPHLTILDPTGKLLLNDNTGSHMVREYGSDAYPFTQQKLQHLKKLDEAAKTNHCLTSTLVSRSRDYVLSADGNQVPVRDLQGKTVGLYFSMFSFKACMEFTPKLVQVYENLKAKGESFEIVMIPLDVDDEEEEEEESFEECFPWLSLPLKDRICRKLVRFFDVFKLPTLVIIGEDGRIDHLNAVDAVEEHGLQAFPFTLKKYQELTKQKDEAQTLDSILVSGCQDFAIKNDGAKIDVGSLVGKNILLYFSAQWSNPCRGFQVEFMETYKSIKEKDGEGMEVIFISSDRDEASFKDLLAGMPWLALPFGDSRVASLKRKFDVGPSNMPMVVAIGPDGRTVAKNSKDLIKYFGAEVYPFTKERVKEVGRRWPEKLKHKLHQEHELMRVWMKDNTMYTCNHCFDRGLFLSFRCNICDFDLHPKCAFA